MNEPVTTPKVNLELNVGNKTENKQEEKPISGENNGGVSNTPTPKSNPASNVPDNSVLYADLERPYTDRRSITILPVKSDSLYRKVNDKVIPKRVNYIGSSYRSSQVLSSNRKEVETYFPSVLGIAANNPQFITRVKQYLNNIQVPVDELGKTFDISFAYDKKKYYLDFDAKERKIEEAYQAADRSNIKKLREALNEKIIALNELEASKCNYGHPINFSDYFIYRHCLFYNDVAKDIAFINTDRNIRFYFKDDNREAERAKKISLEKIKAKDNFIKCFNDTELFEAVYIQYCLLNNMPVLSSLAEDNLEKQNRLDAFSSDEPIKFNKICNNKDCKLIGTIEKLIARGELVRLSNTQNITTVDGGFIGANMNETIAWFKDPNNAQFVATYINKLKNS